MSYNLAFIDKEGRDRIVTIQRAISDLLSDSHNRILSVNCGISVGHDDWFEDGSIVSEPNEDRTLDFSIKYVRQK